MVWKDKELRGFLGSSIVFALVMGLLLFLAFFEIPEANNDIFKVIVGMLVGSLTVVIYTFIGKNPEEVESLRNKNSSLERQVDDLTEEKDKIENLLREFQTEVIDKLAIAGQNFQFQSKIK